MGPSIDLTSRSACTQTDTQFPARYDARAHFEWVLSEPHFRVEISLLRAVAEQSRRAGLPWRETAAGEILAGHTAGFGTGERFQGRLRKLGSVLPPRLRGLVRLVTYRDDVPVEIPASHAASNAERLQRCCKRLLDPDAPKLSEADGKWMRRELQRINPGSDPMVKLAIAGFADFRTPAAISATHAAVGSWHYLPPAEGRPDIGRIATMADGSMSVVPFQLPLPAARRQ